MKKLSAVIITLNEERNIERCLDSLQDIADEIIVVDSFSTDKTEEICKKHEQVRFISHKWEGYSEQKNHANSLATNNLILSIDADEALSDELRQSIQKILDGNLENKVFSVSRLTNYCGSWIRHCGWYPDTKIRIFDKRFTSWKNMKVHEELSLKKDTEIVHLYGDLLHYSYYSISEHIATVNKYTTLAAEEAFAKGKKKNLLSILISSNWRFFRDYFIKGGFKDGFYGFVICGINAFSRFLRYVKLRQLYYQAKKK